MLLNQPYYIDRREGNAHLDLGGEWSFFWSDTSLDRPDMGEWKYKTKLPKSLFFSLYEAGVLPHPYKGEGSREYHWVDEKIWYYKKIFTLDRMYFSRNAFLSFEGVAYYSRLWVNGILLGEHEGMFGGPIAEVSEYLNFDGENEIILEVKSANYGCKDTLNLRGIDPVSQIVPWATVHSAGDDFIVMGIYNDIRLDFTEKIHISRPYLYTEKIEGDVATLKLELEIADGNVKELRSYGISSELSCASTNVHAWGFTGSTLDDKVEIRLRLKEKGTGKVVFESSDEQNLVDHDNLSLRDMRYKDFAFFTKTIRLENPRLWEPVDIGEPFLYELEIEMYHEEKLYDRQSLITGIRIFTAKRTAGPKYRTKWDNYSFAVNGKDFFLKGMNWMPVDYVLNLDPKEYKWALTLAKNAGIQMLRLWNGGGIPETDYFYDLCDELGIMVWQEHCLANIADSSGFDREVLESQEAYNIYRLRNHPSLVVHCGGNEFNPYNKNNSATMFTLTHLIKALDPSRLFYYASPDGGSSHSYNDMDPAWYYLQYRHLPFLGESGIHNYPTFHTLKKLVRKEETTSVIPDMMSSEFREKYPELLHHITEYEPIRIPRMQSRMSQIGDISKMKLEDFCESAQVQAYEYYLYMVQAMRSQYPVSGGVMPWVFKRSWSTAAIQLVDGAGRPTYPYYAVKNAYKPIDIALKSGFTVIAPGEELPLEVMVFNDKNENLDGGEITLTIYSPDFSIKREDRTEVRNGIKEFLFESFTPDESFTDRCFLISVELRREGTVIARNTYFKKCTSLLSDEELFKKHREHFTENLTFENGPWLKAEVKASKKASLSAKLLREGETNGYRYYDIRVHNCSENPAYPVTFEVENNNARFMAFDNFFFLKPDEYREIRLICDGLNNSEKVKIKVSAWNTQNDYTI